jgi:hypothetical protein
MGPVVSDDWREEKHSFDHSYRRTGKTTQLCQAVADALRDDPELRVVITGAHITRNESQYRQLLYKFGADLNRVRFVAPARIERAVMGFRGKLYCDDFTDLDRKSMEGVIRAEQYLGER